MAYCPSCAFRDKRIAELEAERDYEHARAGEIADLADGYKARAEKAEAEVERLRAVCDLQNRLIELMGSVRSTRTSGGNSRGSGREGSTLAELHAAFGNTLEHRLHERHAEGERVGRRRDRSSSYSNHPAIDIPIAENPAARKERVE